MFATSPPSIAGTVGAIFNSFLQLGGSIGVAVSSTIITSVNGNDTDSYSGRAAAWWFVLGVVGVETVVFVSFYRQRRGDDDLQDQGPSTEISMSEVSYTEQPDMEGGDKLAIDKSPGKEMAGE